MPTTFCWIVAFLKGYRQVSDAFNKALGKSQKEGVREWPNMTFLPKTCCRDLLCSLHEFGTPLEIQLHLICFQGSLFFCLFPLKVGIAFEWSFQSHYLHRRGNNVRLLTTIINSMILRIIIQVDVFLGWLDINRKIKIGMSKIDNSRSTKLVLTVLNLISVPFIDYFNENCGVKPDR